MSLVFDVFNITLDQGNLLDPLGRFSQGRHRIIGNKQSGNESERDSLGVQIINVYSSLCRIEQPCHGLLRGSLSKHIGVCVHFQREQ